jgi:putative solute:sodium symporter small subunit
MGENNMSSTEIIAADEEEARASVYRRECRSTLAFGTIYLLMAHTGLFAIFFGYNNDVRVLGFPLHYFIAIIAGSLGVLIVSIVWNIYADRLEAEIQKENNTGMEAGQ